MNLRLFGHTTPWPALVHAIFYLVDLMARPHLVICGGWFLKVLLLLDHIDHILLESVFVMWYLISYLAESHGVHLWFSNSSCKTNFINWDHRCYWFPAPFIILVNNSSYADILFLGCNGITAQSLNVILVQRSINHLLFYYPNMTAFHYHIFSLNLHLLWFSADIVCLIYSG